MNIDPSKAPTYPTDTYQNFYTTALNHTNSRSDNEGFGLRARGWSLLTAAWSLIASPFQMLAHSVAAVGLLVLKSCIGQFSEAKKDFSDHAFKVLDAAGKMITGTIMGVGGVFMPQTAAKINAVVFQEIGKSCGTLPFVKDPSALLKEKESRLEMLNKSEEEADMFLNRLIDSHSPSLLDKEGKLDQTEITVIMANWFHDYGMVNGIENWTDKNVSTELAAQFVVKYFEKKN